MGSRVGGSGGGGGRRPEPSEGEAGGAQIFEAGEARSAGEA